MGKGGTANSVRRIPSTLTIRDLMLCESQPTMGHKVAYVALVGLILFAGGSTTEVLRETLDVVPLRSMFDAMTSVVSLRVVQRLAARALIVIGQGAGTIFLADSFVTDRVWHASLMSYSATVVFGTAADAIEVPAIGSALMLTSFALSAAVVARS